MKIIASLKKPKFITLSKDAVLRTALTFVCAGAGVAGAYPFGLALVAASSGYMRIVCAAALIAGSFVFKAATLKYSIAVCMFLLLSCTGRLASGLAKAVSVGVVTAIAGIICFFIELPSTGQIVTLALESFLAGGMCYLLCFDPDTVQSKICTVLLTGAVICTASFFTFAGGFNPASTLAVLVCLWACFSLDSGNAVFASVVMAFMAYMNSDNAVLMVGVTALGAVMSALLKGGGKVGTAVGFIAGEAVSLLYIGSLAQMYIIELVCACVIFVLLPYRLHFKIAEYFSSFTASDESVCESNVNVKSHLQTVAKAVSGLGEGIGTLSAEAIDGQELKTMFDTVSKRICSGCAMEEKCWSRDADTTYKKMLEILSVIEENGVCTAENVPNAFRQVCIKTDSFVREFNHLYELHKQSALHSGEKGKEREIMIKQYERLSDIIMSLAEEMDNPSVCDEIPDLKFKASVSHAQYPTSGICGDVMVHFAVGTKYYVLLCDGMGQGVPAHRQSNVCAKLLTQFLKAGFSKEQSLGIINSALAFKNDSDSFSTVDLLELDLALGTADFLKVGSAQSFIKTKNSIEDVFSASFPVGIMEDINPVSQSVKLKDCEMIIMVSDGITDLGDDESKTAWIKKMMRFENRSPQELCHMILEGAKSRSQNSDDMTVVIITPKAT